MHYDVEAIKKVPGEGQWLVTFHQHRKQRERKQEVGWDYKLSMLISSTPKGSIAFPNSTRNWDLSGQINEAIKDIYHLKHHNQKQLLISYLGMHCPIKLKQPSYSTIIIRNFAALLMVI